MEKKHDLIFCPQCGLKLDGDEVICPSCGYKLAELHPFKQTNVPVNPPPPIVETPVTPPPVVQTPPPPIAPPPPPVQQPPVTPPPPKVVIPVDPPVAPKKTSQKPIKASPVKQPPLKKDLGIVWIIVIAFFGIIVPIGGPVAFLIYYGNSGISLLGDYIPTLSQSINIDTAKQKSSITVNNIPEKKTVASKTDSASLSENKPDDNKDKNQNSQAVNVPNSEMKFFIIAGCYDEKQQAESAVEALKSKGYAGARIVNQNANGGWRICYKAYLTKQEAINDLGNIRQNEKSSAWIYAMK